MTITLQQQSQTAAPDILRIQQIARRIRVRALGHTLMNKGGYLSQACSSAEIFASLYAGILNLGPSQAPLIPVLFAGVPGRNNSNSFTGALYNGPQAPDLDRFFISPVHYALVLYVTLIEMGRLAPEGLEQFNQDGSTVEMIGAEHSPGIEVTAGSFGQALSQAGGVALARKLRAEPGMVWAFLSDGEMQEGQTWEAFAALSFHKLDNVAVFIDANDQQCDGEMSTVMNIAPLRERLQAFGAAAYEVDGHDVEALLAAANQPHEGKPLVIVARTDPRRGIAALQSRDHTKMHYVRFAGDDERRAFEAAHAELSNDEEVA